MPYFRLNTCDQRLSFFKYLPEIFRDTLQYGVSNPTFRPVTKRHSEAYPSYKGHIFDNGRETCTIML